MASKPHNEFSKVLPALGAILLFTCLASAADFQVNSINLNRTDFDEGKPIEASVNVSNLEADSATTDVDIEFQHYESGKWVTEKTETFTFSSSGNDYSVFSSVFTPQIGDYRVRAIADPDNIISEPDESNNEKLKNFNIPLYGVFFGKIKKLIDLSDSQSTKFYEFENADITGTVYFVDSDATFSFNNVQPISSYKGLGEADKALNSQGLDDSVQNVWGEVSNSNGNGKIKGKITRTGCFMLGGSENCNVPVSSSTGGSFFDTGIVYAGKNKYRQNDPLLFISKVVESKDGGYGTYDYEAKIPSTLSNIEGNNDKLDIYVEIS